MLLTVFTPTYNRAYSLTRLFESLNKQSDTRFEWLIVDDGSTDNTGDLIQSFMMQPHIFEIRYYKQLHKGKPSAQNMAIDLAHGDFFITCDSNKYMHIRAVERILEVAQSIQHDSKMCGVGGYRANFGGEIYGGEMLLEGNKYIDCSNLEREKYNLLGDKSTAFRTELLRKYKSPIFDNETFITEAVWLIPMACAGYKIRWFPEIICYGEYEQNGLTMQGANEYKGHFENYFGFLEYVKVYIKAYGYEKGSHLLNEVLDIAKKKGVLIQEVAKRIECSTIKLRVFLVKKRLYGILFALKQNVKKWFF